MKLEDFCAPFSAFLEKGPEASQVLKTGKELLAGLLREPHWFGEILSRMVSDPGYLEAQASSVFANEVSLYRSPDRQFSVMAFLWEPGSLCPVHDHSSWGMIGSLLDSIVEIRFRRLDDAATKGFADLERLAARTIRSGEVVYVAPLDRGIHQTGAATDRPAVSIGVYGRSIRKGYIHFFSPSEKKVERAYPPRIHKQLLAVRALKSAPEIWTEELDRVSSHRPLPEYLAQEL